MSIGLASSAVQAAVYTLLNGDSTLTALAPIYDEPPEGAAFPYVLLGQFDERPANRMGGKVGREVTANIEAYTEARGAKNLQQILGRVDVLLDNNTALSVTGYHVELCNLDTQQLLREGILRRGVSTYKIQVSET